MQAAPRALCAMLVLAPLPRAARADPPQPAPTTEPEPKPAPPGAEDLALLRDLELLQDLDLLRGWDPTEDLPIPSGEAAE